MKFRSHKKSEVIRALRDGESVWHLDTGIDNVDDVLIGTLADVTHDICYFNAMEKLPETWQLKQIFHIRDLPENQMKSSSDRLIDQSSSDRLTDQLTDVAIDLERLAHDPSNGPALFTLGLDENGDIAMLSSDEGIYCSIDAANLFEDAEGDEDLYLQMRKQSVADWLAMGIAARDFRSWLEEKELKRTD